MHFKADPSPPAIRMRPDGGESLILTDQSEGVAQGRIVGCFECVAIRMKARFKARQEPRQIRFALRRGP